MPAAFFCRESRSLAEPTLAGEDFPLYPEKRPGSGPQRDAERAYGLHHPEYRLREELIPLGMALFAGIALSRRANRASPTL